MVATFTELVKGDINSVGEVVDMATDIVLDKKVAKLAKDTFHTGIESAAHGEALFFSLINQ